LIADGLLAAGALGAAFYCFVLSRRLAKFNDLENGVGGAVAVLSGQVDDLTKALERARRGADRETEKLQELTARAEAAAQQLELLMASMHDLPDAAPPPRRTDLGPDDPADRPADRPVGRSADRPTETAARSAPERSGDADRPRSAEPIFSRAGRRA
jgi:hypothetical protein